VITEVIKFFKLKGSHGYDEIPAKILKFSSPFINSPLAYISNKMLSTGIFPDRLKYAEINPLFKDGCKNDPFNYRPISLLTTFSKIFEKIILSRLNRHAAYHSIFVSEQFGFRRIASTNLSHTCSSRKIVRHGVPHDSIIGPLLFLFYINNLPLNFNSTIKSVLFADGISLVVSSYNNKQYIHDVNITFARLNDWLNSNLLTLNFYKTNHVKFAAKSTSSEITVSYHNNAILSM
jgi:Notch-like protein